MSRDMVIENRFPTEEVLELIAEALLYLRLGEGDAGEDAQAEQAQALRGAINTIQKRDSDRIQAATARAYPDWDLHG